MISTILVATDGSEGAAHAERFGVALASRMKARLLGISVVEDRFARGFAEDGLGVTPPSPEPVAQYLRLRAEASSARLGKCAASDGVEYTGESTPGIADDKIVERGQQADVTVLGRDGQSASHRSPALIGSVVSAVIRKSTRTALVVPTSAQLAGPIVLAFDGSPGSRVGAGLAVQIAKSLGEPIHVFVDSKDKGRAVARFDEVRGLVGTLPVPVREISSTLGRPDVKIVDSAREVKAGLIVMGAYGRNRITEYFLGSNAAAVVRTSPVAVLLAR
jgi:nucleotide-binding universal stress UspA family protein